LKIPTKGISQTAQAYAKLANTPDQAPTSSQQVQRENNERLSSSFDSNAESDPEENEAIEETWKMMNRRTAEIRKPPSSPPGPSVPSASQSFSPVPSQVVKKLTGAKLQSLTNTGAPPRMSSPFSLSQMAPPPPSSATPRPTTSRWRSLDQVSQAGVPEVREQHAAIKQTSTPTPSSQVRGSLLGQNIVNDSDGEEEESSSSSDDDTDSDSSSDDSSSGDSDEEQEDGSKKQPKKKKKSSNIPAEKSASAAAKKNNDRKGNRAMSALTSLLKFGSTS